MPESKEARIRSANDELLTKGHLDRVAEFFSVDYLLHAGGKDYSGHAPVPKFIGLLRTAIPNTRVVDVTVLCQADNTITWRRTIRGTHSAPMKGIPPSGKRVEWRDIVVSRFEAGLIAEEWSVSELAGALMLKLPKAPASA